MTKKVKVKYYEHPTAKELEAMTAEFFKSGGKVTRCPTRSVK